LFRNAADRNTFCHYALDDPPATGTSEERFALKKQGWPLPGSASKMISRTGLT
jgi:hypothetical protein